MKKLNKIIENNNGQIIAIPTTEEYYNFIARQAQSKAIAKRIQKRYEGISLGRTPKMALTPHKTFLADKKCMRCGSIESLTKDHIYEKSDGGFDLDNNVQPLCIKCHKLKTSMFAVFRCLSGKNLSMAQSQTLNSLFLKERLGLALYKQKDNEIDVIKQDGVMVTYRAHI